MARAEALPGLAALDTQDARDALAQAQAALADGERGAVMRALRRLHAALVPSLDQLLAARGGEGAPCSSGVGLLGLFEELPDIDCERDALAEPLLRHAARALEGMAAADGADALPPLLDDDQRDDRSAAQRAIETQWAALAAHLGEAPLPRSRWWRRLRRGGAPLPDDARVLAQRGDQFLWERVGPGEAEADADAESDLGALCAGDRLTLQVPVLVPGRVAVLAAVGDEAESELTVLLPQSRAEDAQRRRGEVVEVIGEVAPAEGAPEQALVVLWVPELVPEGFAARVAAQRRLPPGARLRRYRYRVT